jgi:hypothetical protein
LGSLFSNVIVLLLICPQLSRKGSGIPGIALRNQRFANISPSHPGMANLPIIAIAFVAVDGYGFVGHKLA